MKSPFDLVLAFAVLTFPGEPPATPPCPLFTIQAVAVHLEILDPRECRYVLARAEDWPADMKLLCRRYQELADAPPLIDHERWPGKELLDQCLQFNREYRGFLRDRMDWDILNRDMLVEAISQAEELACIYGDLRDTQQTYYYVHSRRAALARVREKIGFEMYYAGCLPPPAPVWSFRRID